MVAVSLKKKILIKIGEFFCSHFNTEDGRKKQHFGHIMLYYFKKGKNATEGFPGGAVVENLPANAGDTGSSPCPGRSHMPQSN